jgi:hypothetical protein
VNVVSRQTGLVCASKIPWRVHVSWGTDTMSDGHVSDKPSAGMMIGGKLTACLVLRRSGRSHLEAIPFGFKVLNT